MKDYYFPLAVMGCFYFIILLIFSIIHWIVGAPSFELPTLLLFGLAAFLVARYLDNQNPTYLINAFILFLSGIILFSIHYSLF